MSYRKRDSKVEKEISSFLDTYFYPKIVNNFNRYSSKEDQLSGKDVSFSYMRLSKLVVDEKAATHYINKNIRTFAFELSFLFIPMKIFYFMKFVFELAKFSSQQPKPL